MAKLAIRSPGVAEVIRELTEEELILGRAPECSLCVSDGAASRRHCRLSREGRGYILSDLGGRNPARVNGAPLTQPVRLRTGDLITLGRSELLYVCAPEEFAADASFAGEGLPNTPDGGNDAPRPRASDASLAEEPGCARETTGALSPISEAEAEAARAALPPPEPAAAVIASPAAPARGTAKFKGPVIRPDAEKIRALAAYRNLRARNDALAKVVLFLLFGVPFLALDIYIIWYLFYSE